MKKVFAILAVAGLLTACNNDASSDKEAKEPEKEVPASADSDTSKMMTDPSHNMMPPDSTGRRPRD